MSARELFDVSGGDVFLRVHVQPRAGTTKVLGRHGDALKLRIAAPPVDGRANEATACFLADQFGIPRGDVELSTGATSRLKRFRIRGLDEDKATQVLSKILEEHPQTHLF